MRGGDEQTGELFSYVNLEKRVRSDHPLRAIRGLVNVALVALEQEFAALYAPIGRPSIAPEKLLRAMLLQAFYSIRSERQLMERLEFVPLVRGHRRRRRGVGSLSFFQEPRAPVGRRHRSQAIEHSSCTSASEAASEHRPFLRRRHVNRSLGVDEEFQAEGWLGRTARGRRRTEPGGGFSRREALERHHASTTDPEARLYRKGPGKEAKLCFMGHALMENRNGLVVEACLTPADGHAERVAALHMIEPHADRPQAITLGADKAYDAEDFINELRSMKVTPHVAQNTSGCSSAIDGRTTRHAGYAVSQRIRKRIEEAFGWIKMVAGLEQTKFRGRDRVGWAFRFAATAYNLTRLPKLLAASA